MSGGVISGKTYTLKDLFEYETYRIDYYQREYAWSEDDVRTLLTDLMEEFKQSWANGRGRRFAAVEPYFLGPFVFSQERDRVRFLVDGQQRFTTLHLIFLHLYRLTRGFRRRDASDKLSRAILEFQGSRRKFRIDIDERWSALNALYEGTKYELPLGASLSLRNLWARSRQINEHLDRELTADLCGHFVDWLLEKVVLVGIQASSRDSGYRIFESMNDRGARLTPVDLVKSFLLSHVGTGEEELNKQWRSMLAEVTTIRDDADAPKKFLKAALIGRYARIENENDDRDVKGIDSALSVWVRKNSVHRLGLRNADDYLRFVEDLLKLSQHYVMFSRATKRPYPEDGLSALFYNDVNGIINQIDLIMAAVRPQDVLSDAKAKAALVGNFLDRTYVLRALTDEPLSAADFEVDIRRLIPRLRQCKTKENVADTLSREIVPDSFESLLTFGLRGNNRAQVRYVLARLTAYTEVGCGGKDLSDDYLNSDRAYQIEHLLPNHPEWHKAEFENPVAFRTLRSRIGGLALIKRRDNASLKDMPFLDKVNLYSRQNNLIAILSPGHRTRNPSVRDFIRANDIQSYFRDFGRSPSIRTVVESRSELFRRLSIKVWDPSGLGFVMANGPEAEDESSTADMPVPKAAVRRRPAKRLNTDLAKMVRGNVIAADTKIVLTHNNVEHFATVDADGQIWFPTGDPFTKLDEAGRMITEKRCDGMREWKVVLPTGDRISVRDLRDSA